MFFNVTIKHRLKNNRDKLKGLCQTKNAIWKYPLTKHTPNSIIIHTITFWIQIKSYYILLFQLQHIQTTYQHHERNDQLACNLFLIQKSLVRPRINLYVWHSLRHRATPIFLLPGPLHFHVLCPSLSLSITTNRTNPSRFDLFYIFVLFLSYVSN